MKRLRIHPSVLAFWYSSDELPPEHVEQAYLDVFKTQLWPNPVLASASNLTSNITGPTGVKVCACWGWSVMNLSSCSRCGGTLGACRCPGLTVLLVAS